MSYLNIIVIVVIFAEVCCNLNLLNIFSNIHSAIFRIIFILIYIVNLLLWFAYIINILVYWKCVDIVLHVIFNNIFILLFIILLFLVRMVMKRFINLIFYLILIYCISIIIYSNIVICEISFTIWQFVIEYGTCIAQLLLLKILILLIRILNIISFIIYNNQLTDCILNYICYIHDF